LAGLLNHTAPSETRRRNNDRHRPAVVAATLAVLCVYLYLFTPGADYLGLPLPQELAARLGIASAHVFDRNGLVGSNLFVEQAQLSGDRGAGLLVLLLVITGAFLSAYFLPLQFKQGALVLWSLAGVALLYGSQAAAGLLMAHLTVYLVFHPGRKRGLWLSALAGLAGYWVFLPWHGVAGLQWWPAAAFPVIFTGVYRYAILPLLGLPRAAGQLRALVIYAAIVAICLGLADNVLGGTGIEVPLGIMLFFFQWARLAMYHADYQDGRVPLEVPLDRYLAVFLSPGVLPNWGWAVTIPQGYAYVNARFLSEDKNRIVLGGLQLLGIALFYLVAWNWMIRLLIDVLTRYGVEVYEASIRVMAYQFSLGHEISTASVLLTTLLELAAYVLVFAGVVHFKVGIWRICGYHIEPHFNKPWLATNLMSFWTRFAYHYREFLVRVFYYPVFFHFRKLHPDLRIALASMAAAGLGNLAAHLVGASLTKGMELESIGVVFFTWPYFFLLGLGIAISLIFIRHRRNRRRAWALDRWFAVDLLAAYATIQYFALIHIFARPSPANSLEDLFMLFMLGLGIDLG